MTITTPDTWQQWILVLLAGATVAAYVCRLGMLDLGEHSRLAALAHLAMGWATIRAGVAAWYAMPQPLHVATVAVAAAWIVISYRHWRHGVPEHLRRTPQWLDSALARGTHQR